MPQTLRHLAKVLNHKVQLSTCDTPAPCRIQVHLRGMPPGKSLVYHACHHNHPETQAGLYRSSTRFRAPRNTQLQLSTYDAGLPPT